MGEALRRSELDLVHPQVFEAVLGVATPHGSALAYQDGSGHDKAQLKAQGLQHLGLCGLARCVHYPQAVDVLLCGQVPNRFEEQSTAVAAPKGRVEVEVPEADVGLVLVVPLGRAPGGQG